VGDDELGLALADGTLQLPDHLSDVDSSGEQSRRSLQSLLEMQRNMGGPPADDLVDDDVERLLRSDWVSTMAGQRPTAKKALFRHQTADSVVIGASTASASQQRPRPPSAASPRYARSSDHVLHRDGGAGHGLRGGGDSDDDDDSGGGDGRAERFVQRQRLQKPLALVSLWAEEVHPNRTPKFALHAQAHHRSVLYFLVHPLDSAFVDKVSIQFSTSDCRDWASTHTLLSLSWSSGRAG
jgi:hypothetical protein